MSSALLQTTPVTQLQHYLKRFISQPWNNRSLRRKYLSIWGPRYKGILVSYSPYAEQAALAVVTRHYVALAQETPEKRDCVASRVTGITA